METLKNIVLSIFLFLSSVVVVYIIIEAVKLHETNMQKEALDNNKNASVFIYTESKNEKERNALRNIAESDLGSIINVGSGIVISKHGLILTCDHVTNFIGTPLKISVVKKNGNSGKTYIAKIVAASKERDLAIIKIDARFSSYARLGDRETRIGDKIYLLSYPLGDITVGGLGLTLTMGYLSQKNFFVKINNNIRFRMIVDLKSMPGSSGGGIFANDDGKLIGIVSGYPYLGDKVYNSFFSLAISLKEVWQFLEENKIILE